MLQKTNAKNTTETTKSKVSLQEPSQGAITPLTARVKTASGGLVDVSSNLQIPGGGGSLGAFLHGRTSVSAHDTKLATSTTSESEPSSPKKNPSFTPQVSYKQRDISDQSGIASLFRGDAMTKNKSATGTTSLLKGKPSRTVRFDDSGFAGSFLHNRKSATGVNPTAKIPIEKAPTAQLLANKTLMAASSSGHGISDSPQASDTEHSMVDPFTPPRTEQYVPMPPSFPTESVTNGDETVENALTPVSNNRSKTSTANARGISNKIQTQARHGGQYLPLPNGDQNTVEATIAQYDEYQTPRPFSNPTQSIEANAPKVNESIKADDMEIDTPSLAKPCAKTRPFSNAWDQENPVLEAKASAPKTLVSQMDSISPALAGLIEEHKSPDDKSSLNVVTPGSHLNQAGFSDDLALDGSFQNSQVDESTSGEGIDWESMQGEFSQKIQDCEDIVQVFNSDMLGAMEILEVTHADLQNMEGRVLDQMSKLEELEGLMDSMVESYTS